MAKTNWTPQQEAAITTRNRSVIVAAAAGSGKTAVLVERLLRIISDTQQRTPVQGMVIVTFTNDAAAQMKQRLYQALTDALASLEDTEENEQAYAWLLEQQASLGTAKISTINAFCFDLIRENAESCGVSSQFRIAEPAEETLYIQRAVQQVLAEWSRERPADLEVLYQHFCAKSDTDLESVILTMAGYLRSIAFPKQWMQKALQLCKDTTPLFEAIRRSLLCGLEEVQSLMLQAKPIAEEIMTEQPKKDPFLEPLLEELDALSKQIRFFQGTKESILAQPTSGSVVFSRFSNASKNVDAEKKRLFKEMREIYKKKYEKMKKYFIQPLVYFTQDAAMQQTIIPLLLELTDAYLARLFEVKRRENVLSFDDGERLALSLLGTVDEDGVLTRTELGRQLSEQYDIIMVDEYQDSNNKQDSLFKLLSRDCQLDAESQKLLYGTNAFLVGDVKQSIYRFRLANPQNFMDALAAGTPLDACTQEEMAVIYLNRNFRSADGVIRFVNALFGTMMTQACGEVTYDQNEQLNYGATHYDACPETRTTLVFPFLDEDAILAEAEELDPDNLPDIEKAVDPQAEAAASTIAAMLRQGTPVIGRDGRTRPCQPGDFCILLRSVTKHGKAFRQALQRHGIALSGDAGDGFLQLQEITQIRNLLRILDNPLTDTAMAAALLSPVYSITVEELALLKVLTKERRIYLQIHKFLQEAPTDARTMLLHRKLGQFMQQFEAMRHMAETLSLDALILAIYEETDLLSLQSLYEDADKRRKNLECFVQYARSYREHEDLTAKTSLNGWMYYLDGLESHGKDLEAKSQGNAVNMEAVSIKTIHRSKGLEFPFVFLAHLETKFHQGDLPELYMQDDGILGMRVLDRQQNNKLTTAAYQYIAYDMIQKQKSEEMRLLYVGLTRAMQQLFLVMDTKAAISSCKGSHKTEYAMAELLAEKPELAPLLAAEVTSMQEWVLQFLLSGPQAKHLLHAIEGKATSSDLADYQICEITSLKPAGPQKAAATGEADAAALQTMRQQLGFTYRSAQVDLVSKYSVTTLAHPEKQLDLQLDIPKFVKEDTEEEHTYLRGAERGTAVHKMLQYMNFHAAAVDVEGELQRLCEEGYLDALEAKTLSPHKLRTFFASPLYQRIAASPCVYKEKQIFVKIGELALPTDSELYLQYRGTEGILIGTVDLLFQEGDGLVLVDYKTDYVTNPADLTARYALQLGLYQKAVERIFGMPVTQAFLYSFSLNRALEVDLTGISYSFDGGNI